MIKKYTDYVLGTFITLLSIFYISGQNFHDSQKMLFKVVTFSALIVSLYIKPVRDVRDKWINSFLALAFLSFLFNPGSRLVGISSLIDITLVVLLFYLLINYISNTNIVYSSIIVVVALNAIMVIFQFFKIDPLCLNDVRQQNEHIVGLFGHPMNLGAYMATVLPYLAYKNIWLAVIAGILMFASRSWAAGLVGMVGLLFYYWFKNKKVFKVLITLVILISIVGTIFIFFYLPQVEREYLTRKVTLRVYTEWPLFKVSLGNPYFGYGPGTFKHIVTQVKEIDTADLGGLDVTWNDYLGCALELGFFSILIMFGIVRRTFREFLRSDSPEVLAIFSSLVTIPLGALFHSYMCYMNIGIICIALYVIYQIKIKEEV